MVVGTLPPWGWRRQGGGMKSWLELEQVEKHKELSWKREANGTIRSRSPGWHGVEIGMEGLVVA